MNTYRRLVAILVTGCAVSSIGACASSEKAGSAQIEEEQVRPSPKPEPPAPPEPKPQPRPGPTHTGDPPPDAPPTTN